MKKMSEILHLLAPKLSKVHGKEAQTQNFLICINLNVFLEKGMHQFQIFRRKYNYVSIMMSKLKMI